jgi:hypothetical protein
MPTMIRKWSEPANETQDWGVNVCGFSPYTRFKEPYFRKGERVLSAKGVPWVFAWATAAITVPTPLTEVAPIVPTACAVNPAGNVAAGAGYNSYASFDIGEYGWVEATTGPVA